MSRLPDSIRVPLALLAVVVLSALCAAEVTLAATPRWQWQMADSTRSAQDDKTPPVALWSAAKDRDASQARAVRSSEESQASDNADVQDRCNFGGAAAIFADRVMLRAQQLEAQRIGQGRAFTGQPQLGPHHLSLPPPRA